MRGAGVTIGVFLASCQAQWPHPRYVPQPSSALVEVDAPAPPGRIEEIPPRPVPDSVWVDGEWSWRRSRWAWNPGRWVLPPPRTAFSPWVFVRGADGKFWYAPGVWRSSSGASQMSPSPLAAAHVPETLVVNAGGVVEATGPTLKAGTAPR
jgi:hypothetical protein